MTNPETPSTAPVAWCRSDDFRDALQKVQSFNGWRVRYPDCDMALYAQLQASAAPDADQAEGPSLDDVAELCAEFEYHIDSDDYHSIGILRDMITAAVTRWRAPVAEPVATPSPEDPDADRVLKLAAIIREVDGGNRLGAAALAEAILAHPGFSGCHDGPAALPAPGVAVDRYEFSVFDSDDQEMAGGDAATLSEVVAEGRHYLRQYSQDGPHKLELRRVLVLEYSDATDDHD